jgi:hypothetical protein
MVATSKVSMIFACVPLSLVSPHIVDIYVLVVRAQPYFQTVMLMVLLETVCIVAFISSPKSD